MSSSTYRPDIDGLRAVSILLVLTYHAGLPGVAGGFIGVDVFFVISGFLITGLLAREFNANGRVDLVAFWARRIRRLGPALFTVLAAVLLAAPFLLERISGETGKLAKAALATLALNANHFFYAQVFDYFSPVAESNPLLHMWSLSVEEQYYLAWPLLLLATLKLKQRRMQLALIGLGAIASLFVCWRWTNLDAARAFYLMPARAWELLAGGMLALALLRPRSRVLPGISNALSILGFLLITLSACAWAGSATFPFPLALLPVAGAAMILTAGEFDGDAAAVRVLSARPVAYLGKISYPLYLWHWPLLVMSRSMRLYVPDLGMDLLMLVFAVLLAALTYEFVEKACWRNLRGRRETVVIGRGVATAVSVAAMALLLGAWAKFGWFYSDREGRLSASRRDIGPTACLFENNPANDVLDRCFPRKDGQHAVLLWGDSHANHWQPALAVAAQDAGANLGTLTFKACRPLPGKVGSPKCQKFNQQIAGDLARWKLEKHLSGIVLSARWPEGTGALPPYFLDQARSARKGIEFSGARTETEAIQRFSESLSALLQQTDRLGLRVLIVLASPEQPFPAADCLARRQPDECFVSVSRMHEYAARADAAIRQVARSHGDVRTIDPKSFLCRNGRCPAILDQDIVYFDDDHVSRTVSRASAGRFVADVRWLAGNGSPEPAGRPVSVN